MQIRPVWMETFQYQNLDHKNTEKKTEKKK